MKAKNKTIYYGDGSISINERASIVGLDIRLDGNYNINFDSPDNILTFYKDKRVIAVCLDGEIGDSVFIEYTGNLIIKDCKAVTSDGVKITLIPKLKRNDKFGSLLDNFNGTNTNFENLNEIGVVGEIPKDINVKIRNNNLMTDGGQYSLNGQSYKGYYHIHSDGVAMTGRVHNESSEVLSTRRTVTQLMDKIIKNRTASKRARRIAQNGIY